MCYRICRRYLQQLADLLYMVSDVSRHLVTWRFPLFESLKVPVRLAKHPDRERELEVGVGNGTILVKHPFDRLLRPRSVLRHSETSEQPTAKSVFTRSCLDITILTARSIGAGSGYPAYIRAIVAQHVCTTWVFSCSTQLASSHV